MANEVFGTVVRNYHEQLRRSCNSFSMLSCMAKDAGWLVDLSNLNEGDCDSKLRDIGRAISSYCSSANEISQTGREAFRTIVCAGFDRSKKRVRRFPLWQCPVCGDFDCSGAVQTSVFSEVHIE